MEELTISHASWHTVVSMTIFINAYIYVICQITDIVNSMYLHMSSRDNSTVLQGSSLLIILRHLHLTSAYLNVMSMLDMIISLTSLVETCTT